MAFNGFQSPCLVNERIISMNNNHDILNFWSELNRDYWYCMDIHVAASENPPAHPADPFEPFENPDHPSEMDCYGPTQNWLLYLEYEYDRTRFCMAHLQTQRYNNEICEVMCILFQTCEIHENFVCPDWNIKLLMDTCCNLWIYTYEFECEISTTTATSTTLSEINSTADIMTPSMMNQSIYTVSFLSFETGNGLLTEQSDSINRTSSHQEVENNVLIHILPVASALLAALIILGILCTLKRFQNTKTNDQTSEIQRSQSAISEEYEEYETYFPSTELSTEIHENVNYAA